MPDVPREKDDFRAPSKFEFTEIMQVSKPRVSTGKRERERGSTYTGRREKMHGNDIQECDEHDKRNTAESLRGLTSARLTLRARILVYECTEIVLSRYFISTEIKTITNTISVITCVILLILKIYFL